MIGLKNSIFLGVIQGLTEFLPISSSGHLVLFQNFIPAFSQPGVIFDSILHLGTLLAVLIFFRKEILEKNFRYLFLIFIGTLPAVFGGFLFRDFFITLFESGKLLSVAFVTTGVINMFTDKLQTCEEKLDIKKSFLVGIAQMIAIIPGISRSGATIFAGVGVGLEKKEAAKFSFILSIPAILGANFFELVKSPPNLNFFSLEYFSGFLAALITGVFSIKIVYRFLEERKFRYFGYYCLFLGALSLLI